MQRHSGGVDACCVLRRAAVRRDLIGVAARTARNSHGHLVDGWQYQFT
jgi:hypothetical protein